MIKKIFPWIIFVAFFVLLIIGFSSKDKMNKYTSDLMLKQLSPAFLNSSQLLIDSLYNYTKSDLEYKITFLEFGSSGCIACSKMEAVMKTIQEEYSINVQVVFRNISQAKNLNLMKYYGIVSIPTQIFLDEKGEEIFRHTGYLSVDDIKTKVLNKNIH